MTQSIPNNEDDTSPLSFITTSSLIDELIKRHTGCLVVLNKAVDDGSSANIMVFSEEEDDVDWLVLYANAVWSARRAISTENYCRGMCEAIGLLETTGKKIKGKDVEDIF